MDEVLTDENTLESQVKWGEAGGGWEEGSGPSDLLWEHGGRARYIHRNLRSKGQVRWKGTGLSCRASERGCIVHSISLSVSSTPHLLLRTVPFPPSHLAPPGVSSQPILPAYRSLHSAKPPSLVQARDVEHQLARHHQAMAARLEEVDPAMKEHFIKLQTKHQILTTQELPKRQADANFFDEKVREMEMAVTRDPMRAKASRRVLPALHLQLNFTDWLHSLIPQLELTLIPQLSVSHNLLSQLDDSAASLRIVGALVVASFSFRSLNGTCKLTHTNETDETARTRWSHGAETCMAARRLRDELIRLERKHQMLTEELDGPQVREWGAPVRSSSFTGGGVGGGDAANGESLLGERTGGVGRRRESDVEN